jgi:hypothetical protein
MTRPRLGALGWMTLRANVDETLYPLEISEEGGEVEGR